MKSTLVRFVTILLLTAVLPASSFAKDKKPKAAPGPYVFTSKASASKLKGFIIQDSLKYGYTLESDSQFQVRFAKNAQLPFMSQMFVIPSACSGLPTRKIWSYTLVEQNGVTTVTVQPSWEYPGDYCKTVTHDMVWTDQGQIAEFQAKLDEASHEQ